MVASTAGDQPSVLQWWQNIKDIHWLKSMDFITSFSGINDLRHAFLSGWGLIMDGAVYNNSSLLPIFFFILSSLVEWPVTAIAPGCTFEPSTCTLNVHAPFLTIQIWPYRPWWWCHHARFDKEVAVSISFQFENLGKKEGWWYINHYLSDDYYRPARAEQSDAVVLPLTLSLSFLWGGVKNPSHGQILWSGGEGSLRFH